MATSCLRCTILMPVFMLLAAGVMAQPRVATAPQGCSPAPAVLKKRALALAAESADIMIALRTLDREQGLDPEFMNTHLSITLHHSDDLSVHLSPPYWIYRFSLSEAMRKREPLAAVQVPSAVMISVSPSTIDAPDISRVLVERNGKRVAPMVNRLRPTPMATRLGLSTVLHSGEMLFSCAAFHPGARVTVTAIPEAGSNIERTFTQRELSSITGMKYTTRMASVSGDLVGMPAREVQEVLGPPATTDGARWSYNNSAGVVAFYLYVSEDKIGSARPEDFPLETRKARPH